MSQRPDAKDSFYQKLFLFAAIWNFGAGLLGLMSLSFNIKLFYGMADYPADDIFKLHYYSYWLFIMIMSVGFYLVSKDVRNNSAVAIIAILGKSISVAIWVYLYMLGKATFMVLVAGAGDLALVIFFIRFIMYRGVKRINN